jgi:ribosome-binding factor A
MLSGRAYLTGVVGPSTLSPRVRMQSTIQSTSRGSLSLVPSPRVPCGQHAVFRTNTGSKNAARSVTCMANSRRMARVSKQIEREIGSLFVSDKVVQQAVCPERGRGIDDSLSAMASVVEVEVTNDLQVAKVHVSIYSDESGKVTAMKGLHRIEGYVRKHIGRQIRLRMTPEIRFVLDESVQRSERVFDLLKRIERIDSGEAPPPPVAIADDDDDDFGVVWEDDEDGDAIGSVDLGFFDEEAAGRRPPAGKAAGGPRAPRPGAKASQVNEKDGAVDDGHVEEMLEFFRQDAARASRDR